MRSESYKILGECQPIYSLLSQRTCAVETDATGQVLNERRKHPRYRMTENINIICSDGRTIRGITLNISEGGVAAAISAPLVVGDRVRLEPVGGGAVSAVVQRVVGRIYGFQFLNLSSEQLQRIREACKHFALHTGVAGNL